MTTRRNYQVKVPVPDGALPGMVLSVPVKHGSEKIQIRVPDGCGSGSLLALLQPEGSDDWELKVLEAVAPEDVSRARDAAEESRGPIQLPKLNIEEQRPVVQTVRLDTTAGVIDILIRHDWAPHGARRFMELASAGDLTDLAFYRAIQGCIVQFGLPPKRSWSPLPDDPPTGVPFLLGAVSFAAVGPNSRRSTLFICVGDMSHCLGDKPWETPIGAVEESSLDVLELIDTTYGDIIEFGGEGPDTSRIQSEGNSYLRKNFPKLSYVKSAMVTHEECEGDAQEQQQAHPGAQDQRHGINVEDAAEQATRAALEAATLASQATSLADPDQMIDAVRRAREAANAAEAAAQAAEAAHAAADRSKRATMTGRTGGPEVPRAMLPPQQMVPGGTMAQQPSRHSPGGCMISPQQLSMGQVPLLVNSGCAGWPPPASVQYGHPQAASCGRVPVNQIPTQFAACPPAARPYVQIDLT
ncbi:unnamed protein product [Durusdinium trenchii]|uniref:PPIase cyclophilin-type domain-containing protein n=2 Tax=Durusdinium trenchii TaxID=1381693 RepID=A0ABP0PMW9_9DINO